MNTINGCHPVRFFVFSLLILSLPLAVRAEDIDQFETLRIKLAGWLEEIKTDMPSKSSMYVKDWLVDQWDSQKDDYMIFSVRTIKEYNQAHIPYAINIPYKKILSDHRLDELDTMMTFIVYSDNGYEGVSASVIMNLLGYKTYNLKFGMMDWNMKNVAGKVWKKSNLFPVSYKAEVTTEVYKYPAIKQTSTSLKDIIKSRYISNVLNNANDISISDVITIMENWSNNKSSYQLVSVRKKDDYMDGHIPNAINIPLFELMESEQLKKLDPDKIILVYCGTGHLSELATSLLNLLGYNAQSINYGMMGWNDKHISKQVSWDVAADYPVVNHK